MFLSLIMDGVNYKKSIFYPPIIQTNHPQGSSSFLFSTPAEVVFARFKSFPYPYWGRTSTIISCSVFRQSRFVLLRTFYGNLVIAWKQYGNFTLAAPTSRERWFFGTLLGIIIICFSHSTFPQTFPSLLYLFIVPCCSLPLS